MFQTRFALAIWKIPTFRIDISEGSINLGPRQMPPVRH